MMLVDLIDEVDFKVALQVHNVPIQDPQASVDVMAQEAFKAWQAGQADGLKPLFEQWIACADAIHPVVLDAIQRWWGPVIET
ncbi:hypothetical protein [Larsenimonas suaedae]|uniref:DUF2789 family protein n=1 Tax=Larsenimonas suaedae TaxID=1851019 RepID=A0ABU1GR85_9GAMM|nr:hypothetical protein [Larsenimonas suaedae]MCM2972678.1 hypothetical protein [Larsenimonas suaedae]MDR5894525.1 hypothetical protein [Larsenimonas suaedae]